MFTRLRRWLVPSTFAVILAATTMGVGLRYASTVAGGSDSYGYISQADRWLEGGLIVDQSWVAPAPWPDARSSFAPLGWRPSNVERWLVVPSYPPGLPLLMAAAKRAGGQEAVFWVVPLAGAVLVLATFGIGRRLASPAAGLIAAWLMAVSPLFLFMLVAPMSDVPAAAACAAAFYCLLDRRPGSAALAGIAAGLAIAIRPNLVVPVATLGVWYAVPLIRPSTVDRRSALIQGAVFSTGTIAGAVLVGAFHYVLNGSPFISSYGPMPGAFLWEHVGPNVVRYPAWLVESETPLILAGVAALVVPLRQLWPSARERLAFVVAGLFALSLWAMYCLYLVFDAWWFARFLLPSWPFFMAGTGAVLAAVGRRGGRAVTAAVAMVVLLVGAHQVREAVDRGVFDIWRGDRRHVVVAREVRRMTGRPAAIFSLQHSGSVRYYAGRVSIRYDAIDAAWIDRAIDWLASRGVQSYALLDEWEVDVFKRRFAGTRTVGRVNDPPLLEYLAGPRVFLFGLTEPRDLATPPHRIVDYSNSRSVEPVTLPPLDLTRPLR